MPSNGHQETAQVTLAYPAPPSASITGLAYSRSGQKIQPPAAEPHPEWTLPKHLEDAHNEYENLLLEEHEAAINNNSYLIPPRPPLATNPETTTKNPIAEIVSTHDSGYFTTKAPEKSSPEQLSFRSFPDQQKSTSSGFDKQDAVAADEYEKNLVGQENKDLSSHSNVYLPTSTSSYKPPNSAAAGKSVDSAAADDYEKNLIGQTPSSTSKILSTTTGTSGSALSGIPVSHTTKVEPLAPRAEDYEKNLVGRTPSTEAPSTTTAAIISKAVIFVAKAEDYERDLVGQSTLGRGSSAQPTTIKNVDSYGNGRNSDVAEDYEKNLIGQTTLGRAPSAQPTTTTLSYKNVVENGGKSAAAEKYEKNLVEQTTPTSSHMPHAYGSSVNDAQTISSPIDAYEKDLVGPNSLKPSYSTDLPKTSIIAENQAAAVDYEKDLIEQTTSRSTTSTSSYESVGNAQASAEEYEKNLVGQTTPRALPGAWMPTTTSSNKLGSSVSTQKQAIVAAEDYENNLVSQTTSRMPQEVSRLPSRTSTSQQYPGGYAIWASTSTSTPFEVLNYNATSKNSSQNAPISSSYPNYGGSSSIGYGYSPFSTGSYLASAILAEDYEKDLAQESSTPTHPPPTTTHQTISNDPIATSTISREAVSKQVYEEVASHLTGTQLNNRLWPEIASYMEKKQPEDDIIYDDLWEKSDRVSEAPIAVPNNADMSYRPDATRTSTYPTTKIGSYGGYVPQGPSLASSYGTPEELPKIIPSSIYSPSYFSSTKGIETSSFASYPSTRPYVTPSGSSLKYEPISTTSKQTPKPPSINPYSPGYSKLVTPSPDLYKEFERKMFEVFKTSKNQIDKFEEGKTSPENIPQVYIPRPTLVPPSAKKMESPGFEESLFEKYGTTTTTTQRSAQGSKSRSDQNYLEKSIADNEIEAPLSGPILTENLSTKFEYETEVNQETTTQKPLPETVNPTTIGHVYPSRTTMPEHKSTEMVAPKTTTTFLPLSIITTIRRLGFPETVTPSIAAPSIQVVQPTTNGPDLRTKLLKTHHKYMRELISLLPKVPAPTVKVPSEVAPSDESTPECTDPNGCIYDEVDESHEGAPSADTGDSLYEDELKAQLEEVVPSTTTTTSSKPRITLKKCKFNVQTKKCTFEEPGPAQPPSYIGQIYDGEIQDEKTIKEILDLAEQLGGEFLKKGAPPGNAPTAGAPAIKPLQYELDRFEPDIIRIGPVGPTPSKALLLLQICLINSRVALGVR